METSRIYQDEKGVWHWVYSLPMFKNFSILRTILKALGICCLVPLVFVLYLMIRNRDRSQETLAILGMVIGIMALVMLIAVLCYLGVAKLYGGYYVCIYSMDENQIITAQPVGQANKSAAIGIFAATAGVLGNNPGIVLAGIAVGASEIVRTRFDKMLTLKIDRKGGEIRIHSFLTWYSIYVNQEDFDFVAEYMSNRAKNAKISEI